MSILRAEYHMDFGHYKNHVYCSKLLIIIIHIEVTILHCVNSCTDASVTAL